MADFFVVSTRMTKGVIEIYPNFICKKSSDLMIRGGDFYAVWLESEKRWSTDEDDVLRLIDNELDDYYAKKYSNKDYNVKILHMWDAETNQIDKWHKYCQKQLRDNYHSLDEKLIFSNMTPKKKDYASKVLPYPLEDSSTESYDRLVKTLYSDEELEKIEWAIGSIINGDSKKIQKFLVLYGAPKTGKSTIINIIQMLFDGYYSVFDAKALGSSNNSFALEAFKSNPLVAIQHDGDLSHIEDNTRLNSLVSHETMMVNEKFKSAYANKFISFLIMGTNKPVKITDAKSGLMRRLIDVTPTGNRVSRKDYDELMKKIKFELGGIATKCLAKYEEDPNKYENYTPLSMLSASNDFYNYILDSYSVFKEQNGTTMKAAWDMYNKYCEFARVPYPIPQRVFKEELKNYFKEYKDRFMLSDGTRVRSYYLDFDIDKIDNNDRPKDKIDTKITDLLYLKEQESLFDKQYGDYKAQYANSYGVPCRPWSETYSKLSELDTKREHYFKGPENLIVIDFDMKEDGKKSLKKNVKAASEWPETYAETSRSGKGIHLHYIYNGDVSKLKKEYDTDIEIKVFTGNSALRRKLYLCNDFPIATISNDLLPTKGEEKMVSSKVIEDEKHLRTMIRKNLNKEIHNNTKQSICFISKLLNDAYESGIEYDVSDMRNDILIFAINSTNQSDYCIAEVEKMPFKSEREPENIVYDAVPIVFFDCEVFPNLLLINYKFMGENQVVKRLINPSTDDIEQLIKYRLIGFNNRQYDNHILYGRLMGFNNEQIYRLSHRIINSSKTKDKSCFFREAYNLSYSDILDFSAKKQSLKKFEIELGIHHMELGLPWDEPVPEEKWSDVSAYCDNDVLATEAVFNHLKADWTARLILADLAGLTPNDTTNTLTTKIIFGNDRSPQTQFNYRDMGVIDPTKEIDAYANFGNKEYTVFQEGKPIFPGYSFSYGKSIYRNEEVGEGGYVYAEPGMYYNIALLDIASMHPSSIVAENLFGDVYTSKFKDILDARIAIKHGDFDKARTMLDGKLAKYLDDENIAKDLAQALKIAINSVYGLTSAKFSNPFKDPRNMDNLVAKRGALFMINLKHEVQDLGYTVAHIKTDSIKIPNADEKIINFVMEYGKRYGYNFEHEATYEKMCLVNDAVYIAKYDNNGPWTATGKQFQVPYVFKKLFSKESIMFPDLCETHSVTTALYLDRNEGYPDVSYYEKLKDVRKKAKKGTKISKKDTAWLEEMSNMSDEELDNEIAKGHNYIFVGKVGNFSPVVDGADGGLLVREQNGEYYTVSGATGYRWLESELVEEMHMEHLINMQYWDFMAEDAKLTIMEYGYFDKFIESQEYLDTPPWFSAEDDTVPI